MREIYNQNVKSIFREHQFCLIDGFRILTDTF